MGVCPTARLRYDSAGFFEGYTPPFVENERKPFNGEKEKNVRESADEQEEKMTKTRKNVTLIILITCLFAFVGAAFISSGVSSIWAAAETYTLSFKSNERESITKSMNGWWSGSGGANGITQSGDLITVDFSAAGNVAYCDGVNLTAGKTYSISVEYKKVSGGGKFHIFYKGSSWKLIKDWISSGDEWATYTTTFTAAIDADTFIIQNPNTTEESVVQFKNVIFYETTEMTVTAGSAIGTLPEVPVKEGYEGYWTIDGEKITADTIYSYGANKTAVAEYKVAYKLSFGSNDYDMASSAETWTRHKAPTVENGVATLTRSASDGTINYAAGVGKYDVEAGKTYKVKLRFKTDANIRFVMSTEVPDYNAKIIPDSSYNYSDYTDISYDYVATKSGKLDFIFQLLGGEGNIFVKDFYCYEEIADSVTVTENDKIGVLPEIPAKEGYEGYWAIDGEKIDENAEYNYVSDKVAVPAYAKIYSLSFKTERDSITKSMNGWFAQSGNVNGIEQSDDLITVDFSLAGGTVYCNQTTVTGKTYGIKVEYKTAEAGKTSEFHLFNTYTAWKAIKTNIPVTDEWKTYEGTFTATTDTDRVTLQVNNANYTSIPLQFRNIIISETTETTVTAGSAIGTLPEVPAKDGYNGYWAIDGEKITADTVYDYNADKIAVAAYKADNKIESVSLSLDGNIGLNIYAKVVDESKVYATVGSVRKELTEYTLSGSNRLYTVGVAAKDYADKIKFEIGDYTAEVGVKDYIEVAKTRFSDNVSLLALLEGLETYCDSAEKYFANETVGSVTATDRGYTGFAPEITGTLPSGVTVRGITLELASMTSIRIYLGGNLSGVSCTVNGEATTVKTTASADGTVNYYLEKSNIAAKDLDETYEFGIGDCKINVSAIAYVNMAMGKQTENFDNLLKALYNYNVAANAYFPDEYDLSEATDMADTLVYAKSLENGVNGTFDNAAKEHYTITNQNVSLTHAVNVPASETAGQRQVTSLKNLKGGTYVSNTMDVFVLTTSNTEKYAKNSTDIISTTWPNGYNKTEKACAPYVNTTRLGYYYNEVNVRNLNFGDNLYLDKTYHVYSDRMYQVYRLINSNSSAVSTIKQVTFQTMIPKSSVAKFEIRNGDTITTSYSSNALGSTEFRYAAFDIEGVGVLAFINTSTDCSFWLIQDNDNYYFRQVKKVGTLEAGGEVSFGTRVYTDTTHDFSGMRAADEIERNPLTADDITVTGHSTSLDGTGFVGYDKLKGHYVMNIAGSGFADAYGEPDKKYIDNIKVVAKDDRDVFFMVHSTCPLEGAALTDKTIF